MHRRWAPRRSAAALFGLTLALGVGEAAHASGQLLEVPVRWCALRGSPAVDNPGSLGEPDTDAVLWRRHERASDRVWLNQGTSITFRSAVTANNLNDKNVSYPIINDPDVDAPGHDAPGVEGDILDPNLGPASKKEFNDAVAACLTAWNGRTGASTLGPIALNVRRLVKSNGTENLQGYGEFDVTSSGMTPANLCANPPTGVTGASGRLAIADYSVVRGFDADEHILAHEFGHVLSLEHGNGLDDDNPKDGLFDGDPNYTNQCDPNEVNAQPDSLMTPGVNANLITPLQRQRARVIAVKYANAPSDPPAALVPGDVIGDEVPDEIDDVVERSIDITRVTLTTHGPDQTTTISHALIDLLPDNPSHQFLAFVDLDDDATTGGAPSALNLGVPTDFMGAELVTRVVVTADDGFVLVPTVWRFQAGAFVEISDPSIQANLGVTVGGEVPQEQNHIVSISFSNAVRGAMAPTVRLQAYAQTPLPEPPGPAIVLNGAASEYDLAPSGGIPFQLFVEFPDFPVAGVTPLLARPGQAVLVEALDLFPNAMTKVFLGDDMVGVGNSDGTGGFVKSFVVPFGAALGERLVTVGTFGTGLTADTTVIVDGLPLVPTDVAIDVKPNSCPNPFNVRKNGVLPVAILGSAALDVSRLDPTLVRLEGVEPIGAPEIEDVAAPYLPITGRTGRTDCTTAGADGFADLVLHFDAQAVAAALGAVSNKQVRVLELTGSFDPALGGGPIAGEDVIVTLTK
jgi:hypothetical protein